MVPVIAAIAGLAVPALLFVMIAAGSGQEHAWGVVISTDTAFLVGALALIGPRVPGRLRVFLLALAVVDDIGALGDHRARLHRELQSHAAPARRRGPGRRLLHALSAAAGAGRSTRPSSIIVWLCFLASGVHPTLAGVAIALLVPVYRPDRRDVEHALDLARTFRQSPNTEYARAAANSLRESISINERLQSAYAPYVAYVILPLFALANAGVRAQSRDPRRRDRVAPHMGHRGGPRRRQVRRRLRVRSRAPRFSSSASSDPGSPSTASPAAPRCAASASRSRCSSSTSRSRIPTRRTRRGWACSRHPFSPS